MQFFQQLVEFIGNHLMLVIAFLVVLTLLIITEGRRAGAALTTQQATALINKEDALVLDIRPKKEFSTGHIVDSINIPLDKLATRISELDKHRERPILVVCNSGQTAGACTKQLKTAGFNVARLAHGINGWKGDNLPLVK